MQEGVSVEREVRECNDGEITKIAFNIETV